MIEKQAVTMPRQASLLCSDEAVGSLARDLLRTEGIRVRRHATGIEFLRAGDNYDDCLIVDLNLPDMTALELLQCLSRPSIPVIVLADNHDIPNAVAAMHAGAADVVERSRLSRDLMAQLYKLFSGATPPDESDDPSATH